MFLGITKLKLFLLPKSCELPTHTYNTEKSVGNSNVLLFTTVPKCVKDNFSKLLFTKLNKLVNRSRSALIFMPENRQKGILWITLF